MCIVARIEATPGPGKVAMAGGKNMALNASEIMIGETWVDPKYRGQGLFNKMVDRTTDGYKTAYIVTDDWNISAKRAFEKAGFKMVSRYSVLNILGFRIMWRKTE